MVTYLRIANLKPQINPNNNRVTCVWIGPDDIERTYTVNQRILSRYTTAEEAKAALDKWTQQNLGYVIADIWFHKNRDATWAIATGAAPPEVWPEDEVEP